MKKTLLFAFMLLVRGLAFAQEVEVVGQTNATISDDILTLTKPSGVNAGDLILAQVGYTTSTGSISIPSGFTSYVNSSSGSFEYAFCYRVADGSEGSSFSFTSSANRNWIGTLVVYRNVNLKAMFEDIQQSAGSLSNGSTTFESPATTSSSGNGLLLCFGMVRHTGTPTSVTEPSGMTSVTSTVASNRLAMVTSQQLNATGSTGAKTFTFDPAQGTDIFGTNRRYFAVSLILRPMRILYSYQSGSFNSNDSWTKDPSGTTLTPSGGLAPAAYDSIVIKNGRVMELTANTSGNSMGLQIDEGAVLDMAGFTFDGLTNIGGKGRIRSNRTNGSVTYFPTTLSPATILDSNGGIIEYYCSSNVTLSTSFTSFHHLELKRETSGTTQYTLGSNLSLSGNLLISRTGTAVSRLTVGNSAVSRSISVGGNALVEVGCEWTVGTGNIGHAITLNGDFTIQGSVRFTNQSAPAYDVVPTDGYATLTFTGAAHNTMYCYGQSNIYRMVVNKGTDQTFVLAIESNDSTHFKLFGRNDEANTGSDPNPTVLKALFIQNGTLKLNENIYLPCLTTGGNDFFINQNAGLWINGAHIVATTSGTGNRGITVLGLLRVTSGRVVTNTGAGIVYRTEAQIIIEGGYVECGQLRRSTNAGSYRASYVQTGGHVVVLGAEDNNDLARFSIPETDCAFTMTGGLLELYLPTTKTGANLLDIGVSPLNYLVTGGSIRLISNAAATEARIGVPGPLFNLEFDDNTGGDFIAESDLTINGFFNLDEGSPLLNMANHNLTLGGDATLANSSTLNIGTGTLTFNGETRQVFSQSGTLTGNLENLVVDKSDTLVFQGSTGTVVVDNDFSLLSGVLDDGGKTLEVKGDLIISSQHTGSGKILLTTTNTRTLGGNGSGSIQNLQFDAPGDATVTVSCNLRITGNLNFVGSNRRVLDMGAYLLVADSFATFTNPGSNRFVRFNGQQSAGGLTKVYTATSFSFPVGSGTGGTYDYTPALISFNTAPSVSGSINIKPVAFQHPAVTTTGRSLTYYWKTSSTGFTLGGAEVSQQYTYLAGDVVTGSGITEAGYVAARFDANSNTWIPGIAANVNTTTKVITFSGATFPGINGEYTAGDNSPTNPFGTVTVYYSRVNNGTWSTASTWTTNPDHTTVATPSTPPNANSIVRIGNGSSVFHNIEVTGNGATSGSLVIGTGSTLDLNQTTGHNFGAIAGETIAGNGTLRMDRPGTTTYSFPNGDFGTFLSANGGTVEYYNTTASNVALPTTLTSYNRMKINVGSTGRIDFPDASLTILDSLVFISTGSGHCRLNTVNGTNGNLVVEKAMVVNGGIVELRNPGSSAAKTFLVKGDFRVGNGATFRIENGGTNLIHSLELRRNLVNEGTLDLYTNASCYVGLLFTGADTASFTGSNASASSDINTLTVDKGDDYTSMLVVDVAGTLSTRTDAWLFLENGTFRFAKPSGSITVWNTNTTYEIPASAALSVNHSSATILLGQVNGDGADLILRGRLEVLNGTMELGVAANNTNNDIEYSSAGIPEIIVSGGSLNVNGQIRRSLTTLAGSLYFKQTGSSAVTVRGRNANTVRGMFEVVNDGSYFEMSGTPTLSILRGGSTTFADLYVRPDESLVTGGTIRFQPSGTGNTSQSYRFDMAPSFYDLEILSSGANTASAEISINALTVERNLTVGTNGTLVTNNLAVNVGGRFTKTGTYTGGTSTLRFFSQGVLEGNFSSQSLFNLTLDSAASLYLTGSSTSLRIDNMLNIGATAILHDSTHLIDVKGNITNYGEHRSLTSTATNTLQLTGTSSQQVYGTGTFGNLVINNTNNVFMLGHMQVNNQLTLSNGILDINEFRLTLGASATVSGTFSNARMIRSNGVLSDGGVQKVCNAGANNVHFPIGVLGKYTPARINITAATASGNVTVKAVNVKHPSTRIAADSQLTFYWQVDATGFGTATATHTYEYIQSDVTGSEAAYVTGRFVFPNWTPLQGISGAVNTSTNTITLSGVSYIQGSFTVGVPNEFAGVSTYYSRKSSGNWDDLDMWSTTGHNGAALSSPSELPVGAPVKIASGDTVNVTGNTKLAESVELVGNAVLNLNNTYAHNLGLVTGTGRIRIRATNGGQFVFPGGNFENFTSASGGTVEFYNTTNGILPTQNVYNHVVFKDASTRTQPNVDITVNGVCTIDGGSITNASFNKNLVLKNNWVNNVGSGGYVPGTGKVNFASSGSQSLDGTTRFYALEFSGGGNKTLLDSVLIGSQLILNGGRVYLGSNYLVADSNAVTSGSPSASAMIVQNGSGRVVKRYKTGSPAFVFPIGEETGTAEYSPVTLVFSGGTFTATANVRVEVVDGNSPSCGSGNHTVSRYWSFTSSGISGFTATVTGKYMPADVSGTESLVGARMSRPSLPCVNGLPANTSLHALTFTGSVLNILAGGEAPLAQPTLPASLLFFTDIGPGQMNITWTKGNGQRRLVVTKAGSAVDASPLDLTSYTADSNFLGSPQNIGSSNFAVFSGSDSSFTLTGLSPATVYHFAIFEYSNSGTESDYLLTNPALGATKTLATEPTTAAASISFDRIRHTSMRLNINGGNGGKVLVIAREDVPVTATPADRTVYSSNVIYGNGHSFGSNQFVVYAGSADTFTVAGLSQNKRYHFAAYEWNGSDSASNYYTTVHRADSQHSYLLLELTVLLEGSFSNGAMIAKNQAIIPVAQPYANPPYNFSSFNSIQSVPGDSLIDWVMIELRKAATASAATPATIKGRAAGFVRPNGRVDDTLALPGIIVETTEPGEFYVVVHHRTHISVMSSAQLVAPDMSHPYYSYNFTDNVTKAYGTNALSDLGGGKWGLYSGRAENGTAQLIDESDRLEMWNNRNQTGYLQTDVNLDGVVDAEDRSSVWNNRNVSTQVPQ